MYINMQGYYNNHLWGVKQVRKTTWSSGKYQNIYLLNNDSAKYIYDNLFQKLPPNCYFIQKSRRA